MDLSTLDATQPPDTQVISQGAQRIRETRDAVKTSFDLEHHLTGGHQFPTGAVAPAAGLVGRLFINTTSKQIERDTGSVYQVAHAGLVVRNEITGPVNLTSGYNVLIPSGIVVSQDANLAIISSVRLSTGSTSVKVFGIRIRLDNTTTLTERATIQIPLNGDFPVMLTAIVTGMALGAHTITLEAKLVSGPATTIVTADQMLISS